MKVLIINGSPRIDGNSTLLIKEITKVFGELNINYEEIRVGDKDIRGCIACDHCEKNEGCIFKDIVNDTYPKLEEADGLIIVSPVYYASPNGTLISFLDRLFRSYPASLKMKVGASFAIARRGGTSATFDMLNKYFTISGMPVVSGDYWNNGFGRTKGEISQDFEGLRNARVVARRMVFLMKSIKDGKDKYQDLLEDEPRVVTNFIKQ